MGRVALLVFVVFALTGCRGSGEDDSQKVVAAFYPLAWAAERIGGDGFDVRNLTPAGAEPHDLELSPRDVEELRDADLVLYAGGGFQPAVEDAVAARQGSSLDVLSPSEADPHVWLDPIRFADVAETIGELLGRPTDASELGSALRLLDAEYRDGLDRCARRRLVTSHAAFGHLAARYGLTQLSLTGTAPESEPGPRDLQRLVDEVRASGATTVFAEPLVSDRLAETVARETGTKVAVLDPLEGLGEDRLDAGEDYFSVMRDNLAALRIALACR